ncbi:two-component sensor histidine kinase [Actinoplanes cyaneus]|uniref:histidine kinase n=1 Tax=Actinoplanes cyaneus TaxID=52696 RepID=A0A919MA21_9ACTN|nr:HAMP domain-containing sensor histidine kinase [Actinoplanes cyaneus]MCW2140715.1 two-component system, OmpR family, sensor histidine kinase BaeS [Actinoplanes cyaneus]GID70058.1 two-component sensor histidine kinase [Actinoplanes cyaneus]
MSRAVPVHRSLVVRLLGTSVLIVVLSVGAAAWLAAKTATRAVQKEQSQSLAVDSLIHDTLLGYAAQHPNWKDVEPQVRRLAGETGRQITLTTPGGTMIAASHPGVPLPARPDALVDPLGAVIDPRAVGPYLITGRDRTLQHALATKRLRCLQDQGIKATVEETPAGRLVVRLAADSPRQQQRDCSFREDYPVTSERAALEQLQIRLTSCLKERLLTEVTFRSTDFVPVYSDPANVGNRQAIQDCIDRARREQLRPYVAAPARLYLTSPAHPPLPVFDLSPDSTRRIAGVTAFVLAVAVTATLVVGLRLVRPLRALTAAADGATSRPSPVRIARNDEIGRLAAAFNALADRSERSEQQRRVMVDDIAHELRSPLTTMRNWLTAGQDGLADLDQDMVRLLLEETGLLQHIVADLADLADADAGTLALALEDQPVRDLLAPVCEAHRNTTLTVAGDPWVVVDPIRFRQIVGNLLTNAWRHTPADGRVEVRAEAARGVLSIDVADTGEGITATDLPHVFDRFWRADRARARATGGSGLGLSIARKLAQAHGGDITVVSTPDVGSTFTVRLPAHAAPDTAAERPASGSR